MAKYWAAKKLIIKKSKKYKNQEPIKKSIAKKKIFKIALSGYI